ncbi:MAG: bifunctional glutamate N-acetyltransferase/amino-acid acetyltransferase ArgJ [Deltaproteobacteria bacterium]|nr:bifunctional glutamate N-acetyltransferase/amino-acid acetyltransferase ArgJ [Deltaproteobacteria bacterium]
MTDELHVPGFLAGSVFCGIKTNGRNDLSLIFSKVPAAAAGVFTTNVFTAAPVVLSRERIRKGTAQAVIVNSGNANAATGDEGLRDALAVSKALSKRLNIDEELVLAASTGVIGERLPLEKILANIDNLAKAVSPYGIPSAEEGIMTTDAFPKMHAQKCRIGGKEITVCGIAKGAGMIEPGMATMLAFIMTDASIEQPCLERVFRKAVDESFNAISVDGCMSTNDMAIIMANGVAGNDPLTPRSKSLPMFREALGGVMDFLARAIVRDGEGSTKVISLVVEGARNMKEARRVAYAIARSNLVKTAFFGNDPNWGRIISAVGASGVPVPADATELFIDGIPLFRNGTGVPGVKERLAEVMKRETVPVTVRLGMGKASFHLYTSDLSYDYVKINAMYHT